MKNEITLCKTFSSTAIFLNLCLVANFIDFLEFINVYQCFFMFNILIDEVTRKLEHEKRKNC